MVSLSSSFQLQTNCQTERAHQELEAALRCVASTNSDHLEWAAPLDRVYPQQPHLFSNRSPPFEASLGFQPLLFPAKEGEHIVPSVQHHLCMCWCCFPGTAQGDHGFSLNRIDGGTLFKPNLQDLVSAADIKPITSQLQSYTTLCCFSPPVIPRRSHPLCRLSAPKQAKTKLIKLAKNELNIKYHKERTIQYPHLHQRVLSGWGPKSWWLVRLSKCPEAGPGPGGSQEASGVCG